MLVTAKNAILRTLTGRAEYGILLLVIFRGMQHEERVASVGPYQQHHFLAGRNAIQRPFHCLCTVHLVAVDFQDDVATLQSGDVR